MEFIIKFCETLLILQPSLIRGCIFQLKVCSILRCDTAVTIHWHVHVIYNDTHEPETKALLLSSVRDISWEAMWPEKWLPFFCCNTRHGQIHKNVYCGREWEREIVFCLGGKNHSYSGFQISVNIMIHLLYSGKLLAILWCLITFSSPRCPQDPKLFS